jgi:hypothetical protein
MSEQEALLANQEVFVALNAHDLEHFTPLLDPAFVWKPEPLREGPTSLGAHRFSGLGQLKEGMEVQLLGSSMRYSAIMASG